MWGERVVVVVVVVERVVARAQGFPSFFLSIQHVYDREAAASERPPTPPPPPLSDGSDLEAQDKEDEHYACRGERGECDRENIHSATAAAAGDADSDADVSVLLQFDLVVEVAVEVAVEVEVEEHSSEDGAATQGRLEPGEHPEETALSPADAPDTPTSLKSTATSSNGGASQTDTEREDSSVTLTEKSSSPDTELNPMSSSTSHEEVDQAQLEDSPTPPETEAAKPEEEDAEPPLPPPEAESSSDPRSNGENGEANQAPEPNANTANTDATILDGNANTAAITVPPPPQQPMAAAVPAPVSGLTEPLPASQAQPQPTDINANPKTPVAIGGIHDGFATLNGGVGVLPGTPTAAANANMPHLPNFLSSHTPVWPPRSYLPESCYTLPLPRDLCARAAQGGLTESHAPNEVEQGGGDIKPEHPMDGHHTLGGTQFFRAPHDLFRELPKVRGGYEGMDALQHPYLQDLYRMQTLVAQKRGSMASLDGMRRDARWRDPNLREVICMLGHPMDPVKANAAAYLQHLCYENDQVKQEVRSLRGVPVLVGLLDHPKAEVHRKACGALRNISFGKDHHNKVAIRNCDGIPALIRLLRKSNDMEVRELVTGTLWNLSSHEPLKMVVINHGLQTLTNEIIIPHSGWSTEPPDPAKPREADWTTVFKNTSGCLRNVSSDGAEARQRLRDCEGLVDALLHALQSAVARKDVNNKAVENCVCILRNLSYHVHKEVPGAERFKSQAANKIARSGGHLCKKEESTKEEWFSQCKRHGLCDKKYSTLDMPKRPATMKGLDLLYQPEVVRLYLSLLRLSQNQNTLEAAAGALQNLSAGQWAWSNYIRATVRKEKGLPVLVELLHSDGDKVVRAVAIALRNLAIDRRNKDLIGSYAMRDLVGNLPCGQQHAAKNLEEDTVVAVLNTIQEIITDSAENARFLVQGQGVQKLVAINKTSQSGRETKAASHILQTVWAYKDLRTTLFKAGWNKSHFKPSASTLPKKVKNGKAGYDDITLPLMEKNQDGYYSVDQGDRLPEAPSHMVEREQLQNANEKRHFIRGSRPAVGLVEQTPPPLDSWV
ncbi:splicing regulator ARVCF [Engraulis encrasicolus]|uniref:splicing regulator ARVCF n=1 Tax=Engraulis encrasicolus TaxID=184585 RepID=UPI002FD299B0